MMTFSLSNQPKRFNTRLRCSQISHIVLRTSIRSENRRRDKASTVRVHSNIPCNRTYTVDSFQHALIMKTYGILQVKNYSTKVADDLLDLRHWDFLHTSSHSCNEGSHSVEHTNLPNFSHPSLLYTLKHT